MHLMWNQSTILLLLARKVQLHRTEPMTFLTNLSIPTKLSRSTTATCRIGGQQDSNKSERVLVSLLLNTKTKPAKAVFFF